MFIPNLIFITGLHYSIHYKILSNLKENIKWYVNHAVSNLIIVLSTTDDSLRLLNCKSECTKLRPTGGLIYNWLNYNDIELLMVTNMMVLHSYHIFCYDNLRAIDYIHHIVMMMIIILAYFMNAGVYMSYFLFFICGMPGMIDYSMLSLQINRRKEKYINTYLNNYIRAPGIIFGLGLMWKDTFNISPFYVFSSFLTLFWNAMYFNYEVLSNYFNK